MDPQLIHTFLLIDVLVEDLLISSYRIRYFPGVRLLSKVRPGCFAYRDPIPMGISMAFVGQRHHQMGGL